MTIYNLDGVEYFTYFDVCPHEIKRDYGIDRLVFNIDNDMYKSLSRMLKTFMDARVKGVGNIEVDVRKHVDIDFYSAHGDHVDNDSQFDNFYDSYEIDEVKMFIPAYVLKTACIWIKVINIQEPSKHFTFMEFMTPMTTLYAEE